MTSQNKINSVNYFRSYTEFCNKNTNIQLRMIQDNIHHYPIIEDLLGFHYWLDDKVAPKYNEIKGYDAEHISGAFAHITFSHNILSFYTILLTIERNLIHQIKGQIRTILESIAKMNYLAFFPEDARLIIIKDRISGIRDTETQISELNQFKKESGVEYFQNFDPEEVLKKIKGKFHYKWFVDKVYADGTKNAMNVWYRDLSNSIHSSFMRSQPKYNADISNKILRDVELLMFYNLLAEVESHREMINEKLFPYQESVEFLEKMRNLLTDNGKMPSLFPDHPDVVSRVMVHPPGAPWE